MVRKGNILAVILNQDGYHRGVRLFNARKYYDAHEVWEDVWREAQGLEKRFLQGLIQTAVAFHHHSTGNIAGARSLMERGSKNLGACPAEYGEIRVNALLKSLSEWRTVLQESGAPPAHPVIERID